MGNANEYFINTDAFIQGNSYLRVVQRQAYSKLKESFEKDPESHKLIVLPTGSGKTGVIAISPYGISKGRVLVITPSLIIREGISDEFDTRTLENFWSDKKVMLNIDDLPQVYRYAGYKTSGDKKRVLQYLKDANIVIANIHKVYSDSSNHTLVDILPPDFFDMIIIDEAHHSAAESWINTLDYFDCSKIVKLTATPFRSDQKEISGVEVYNFPLSDAIKDGIVKNLIAEDYTTEKLEFVMDDRVISKEEALKEMDKNWVTRTVAYSDSCSLTIVKKSIERLEEKRKRGGVFHQIIAVACSIEHAEHIKKMYEQFGYRADYISSDRIDESERAIVELKKGNLDVIVNVNMLGEGFDHSLLSIAAIFRPFRTLSPYAQFIGRTLRRINDEKAIDDIDNIAHVIYHKELDLDKLWQYYINEEEKAITKRRIEAEFTASEIHSRDVGEVSTEGQIISNIQTFLDDNVDLSYGNAIKREIQNFESQIQKELNSLKATGIDEDAIKAFEISRRKQLDEKVNRKRQELRAELIREELQDRYWNDIIERVENLFETTGISPEGNELPKSSNNLFLKDSKDNKAYVRKYINNNVKIKLKRGIDEWETYDFKQAESLIPKLIEALSKKIIKLRRE